MDHDSLVHASVSHSVNPPVGVRGEEILPARRPREERRAGHAGRDVDAPIGGEVPTAHRRAVSRAGDEETTARRKRQRVARRRGTTTTGTRIVGRNVGRNVGQNGKESREWGGEVRRQPAEDRDEARGDAVGARRGAEGIRVAEDFVVILAKASEAPSGRATYARARAGRRAADAADAVTRAGFVGPDADAVRAADGECGAGVGSPRERSRAGVEGVAERGRRSARGARGGGVGVDEDATCAIDGGETRRVGMPRDGGGGAVGVGGAGGSARPSASASAHPRSLEGTSAGTETASPSDADAGGSGRDASGSWIGAVASNPSAGASGASPRRSARRATPATTPSRVRARRADEDLGIALDGRASVGRRTSRARARRARRPSRGRVRACEPCGARASHPPRAMPEPTPPSARPTFVRSPLARAAPKRSSMSDIHLEFLHTWLSPIRGLFSRVLVRVRFGRSYSQNERAPIFRRPHRRHRRRRRRRL